LENERSWFVGVDWASKTHHARVLDVQGRSVGERSFSHGGEGLAEMASWILSLTKSRPGAVHVAIEVPHGPVVESLMERGFRVYAINPKQLDRFRDRFSPAGAKDDSRDAEVLADALRTDPHCFRVLEPLDPTIVQLREWSRLAEELARQRTRLGNRVRELLWRYFPQLLEVTDDVAAPWFLDLWRMMPTPEKAARIHETSLERLLKRYRIRRITAAELLQQVRTPAIAVAAGTAKAAGDHLALVAKQLDLVNRQIGEAGKRIDRLTEQFASARENEEGQLKEQRDVTILRSLPGVGRIILATLLAEAPEALRSRDYHALRCLCGAAPITRRSGKSKTVLMRRAVPMRLRNALYHWARTALQHDPRSKAKYAALRARGHGRALRSVGDRLLAVACAMLHTQTVFNRQLINPCPTDAQIPN
jgi:transposase